MCGLLGVWLSDLSLRCPPVLWDLVVRWVQLLCRPVIHLLWDLTVVGVQLS